MKSFIISLTLSFILALIAYLKKAMTKSALALAFLLAFLITYFGNIACFVLLATVFLGTLISHKIKKEKRQKINGNIIEKSGQKDIYQIIANVLIGTISIIISKITQNSKYIMIYASVLSESLSDSLASDIGILSKKKTINIITLKEGEKGLSGNISILGLISSLFGSIIISSLYFILIKNSISDFLIITFSGFIGAIIDSFLGATLQVKYKCPKCNKIIEQKIHCNTKTEYQKGIKWINNDFINFLSNFIIFLILSIII